MSAYPVARREKLRLPKLPCSTERVRRQIVVAADAEEVPDVVLDAMSLHFPCFSIGRVAQIAEVSGSELEPIRLILVDAGKAERDFKLLLALKKHHPAAMVALTFADEKAIGNAVLDLISFGAVRSVIPMHFRIDVWLSIVRLLLDGAEYYPSIIHRQLWLLGKGRNAGRSVEPSIEEEKMPPDKYIDGLTSREREILMLVARGMQNKLIASELALSENTVKIHLHNIITKLGVHNRTEAAAKLHESARANPVHSPKD